MDAPDLSFTRGLKAPLQGLRWMWTRTELLPYVAVPVALTTLMLGLAVWATWHWGGSLVTSIAGQPTADGVDGAVLRGLWRVLAVLIHLLLLALLSMAAWTVGLLLASPFYDRLSARVEAMVTGRTWGDADDLKLVLSDVTTGLLHSFATIALYLACSCPLLFLTFVPVAGEALQLVIGTALCAWFLALETTDYALSRRRISFADKLRLVRRHPGLMLGHGLASLGLLWFPLSAFVSTPAAVIGGTLIVLDTERAA